MLRVILRGGGLVPNKVAEMRRDQPVNLAMPDRICRVPGCYFGDIVEHLNDPTVIGL